MLTIKMSNLVKRINRRLRSDYDLLMLRKTRGHQAILTLGEYHIHDYRTNFVTETDVDPEYLARELGVLKSFQAVIG